MHFDASEGGTAAEANANGAKVIAIATPNVLLRITDDKTLSAEANDESIG